MMAILGTIIRWLLKTRTGRFVGSVLLVIGLGGAALWFVQHQIHGVWTRGIAHGAQAERAAWESDQLDLQAKLQASENAKQAALNAIATRERDRQREALQQAQAISALQLRLAQEGQANAHNPSCNPSGGGNRISGELWRDIQAADHD